MHCLRTLGEMSLTVLNVGVEGLPVLMTNDTVVVLTSARHADCPKGRGKLPLGLRHSGVTLTALRPR